MSSFLKNFIYFFVFILSSCHTTTKSSQNELESKDCMPERKNQDTIAHESGSIIKIAEYFVILSNDGNSRYLPCNMPESFKKEGLTVKYTLITKEIYPNERHLATPCLLTKID